MIGSLKKTVNRDGGQRFASSKVSRGQVGACLHEEWLTDMAKACCKPCLYVADFCAGSAEVGEAIINVKASNPNGTHARLCLFSHDPRTVFQELGAASCRTLVGELYLDRKLSQPGHEPVADPGEQPIVNRSLLRAELGSPLQVLSMSANGDLLIPDEEEVRQACPFEMNSEAIQTLQKL